jgi:OFA family oxalate/formate antiporter-like MFS transporter
MSRAKWFHYGWVIVVACFGVTIVTGIQSQCQGLFLKPLEADFGWSRAVIASAFTASFLSHAPTGFAMGWLVDKYGPRPLLALAAFLTGGGLALCSQVNDIWDLRLFMFMAGFGTGTCLPGVTATVQRWFVKRRGLALGITMSGTGVGTLVLSPIINQLIIIYGWRTAYASMGAFAFALILISAFVIFRNPEQKWLKSYSAEESALLTAEKGLPLGSVIKSSAFFKLVAVLITSMMAMHVVIFHIVPYAQDTGIPSTLAATALGIMGGSTVVGRLLGGLIGDRMGWQRGLVLGNLGAGALCLLLLGLNSIWMLYLFVVIYGVFSGSLVTTQLGLIGQLFGTKYLAQVTGLIYGIAAFVAAFGPTIAGFVFDIMGSYLFAFLLVIALFATTVWVTLTIKPPTSPSEDNGG